MPTSTPDSKGSAGSAEKENIQANGQQQISLSRRSSRGFLGRLGTPTPEPPNLSTPTGRSVGLFRSHSLDKMENIDERAKKGFEDDINYDISRRRSLAGTSNQEPVFKVMSQSTEKLSSVNIKNKLAFSNNSSTNNHTWAWSTK